MGDGSALAQEQMLARVDHVLGEFLQEQAKLLASISTELEPFATWLSGLLSGGKRLRPSFCIWGYVAAGGHDLPAAMGAAASLELLQAGALIHDDVMDASDVRRGMPAAHRSFAEHHRAAGWTGTSQRFGDGVAILLGDMALCWADELFARSGFDPATLASARWVFDIMRTEVMAGQVLDLVEQARGGGSARRALHVVRFKSAKYTIERPLHLGAALAGADRRLLAALSDYGLPLGEAFQLRDDILGVFGDPDTTGKPAGDDLREGKRTLLLAEAAQRADPEQASVLAAGIGVRDLSDERVEELRSVIIATGAREEVESVITARTQQALTALGAIDVPDDARDALAGLALAATERRH